MAGIELMRWLMTEELTCLNFARAAFLRCACLGPATSSCWQVSIEEDQGVSHPVRRWGCRGMNPENICADKCFSRMSTVAVETLLCFNKRAMFLLFPITKCVRFTILINAWNFIWEESCCEERGRVKCPHWATFRSCHSSSIRFWQKDPIM